MTSRFAFRIHGVLLFLVFEIVSTAGESRAGEYLPWSTYVTNCVDTLIEHGRDQYGPIRSDMLMSIIDVDTLESPPKPYYEATQGVGILLHSLLELALLPERWQHAL